MKRIGFLINPIAGMGGKVGLKGTDGVLEESIKRGAKPISSIRAKEMLEYFLKYINKVKNRKEIIWYICSENMGGDLFKSLEIKNLTIIYNPKKITSNIDTKNACKIFLEKKIDLIIFCGGDGTARDIFDTVGKKIPIIGIPSGVKMHSGVFGMKPSSVAEILINFLNDELVINDSEIMDLDEEKYRKGDWKIKLYGIAKTPYEPTYVQSGKAVIQEISEDDVREGIASYIIEKMENSKDTLYILGSGGTVQEIGKKLKIDTTLLGIDIVLDKKLIAKDINEKELLNILSDFEKFKLILSPIGAQGFILGRGNLQLSAEVISKIGIENIEIISTPAKLKRTPFLRVDIGNKELNLEFQKKEYMTVVKDYRLMCLMKIVV